MQLATKVMDLNRVGQATTKQLRLLGINTTLDLLLYPPFRYDDFSATTLIERLQVDARVNVVGEITQLANKRLWRGRYLTEAWVSDQSGLIKVVWFNQPFIAKNLQAGDKVSLAGKVDADKAGLFLSNPVYEKVGSGSLTHTHGLVPQYHLTAGLTQKQLRFLIRQVIGLAAQIPEWLLPDIVSSYKLMPLPHALQQIHFPKDQAVLERAKQRLAFGELFLLQLNAQLIKNKMQGLQAGPVKFFESETKSLVQNLPFKLTDDQRRTTWEIIKNLNSVKPMTRLLEGDVGSGKTIVAALAIYNVFLNGQQSALMVPTEILAQQHFNSLSKLFAGTGLRLGLLIASCSSVIPSPAKQGEESLKVTKQQLLAKVQAREIDLIIGTHALIQDKVEFNNLNLVVIDEQHRFGVEQRQNLLSKADADSTQHTNPAAAGQPHLLSMTATPIPRSLALALYDDLDISVIKEMPKNRLPVITKIIRAEERDSAYDLARQEIAKGRQVFAMCPLIEPLSSAQDEPDDPFGVKSVKEEYEKLSKQVFPSCRVGMLHGRLKPKIKNQVMADFVAGDLDVLVATSVIEVGIDVPNATVMLIEGADCFGLAQLHQYRGRVGRGEHQSYCLLMAEEIGDNATRRLQALMTYYNGFDLAKVDLELRGPGEAYGTLQKGFPELRIASLFDYELMKSAKQAAKELLVKDPTLKNWPKLAKKIGEQTLKIHLE